MDPANQRSRGYGHTPRANHEQDQPRRQQERQSKTLVGFEKEPPLESLLIKMTEFPELEQVQSIVQKPETATLSLEDAYKLRASFDEKLKKGLKEVSFDSLSFDPKKREQGLTELENKLQGNSKVLEKMKKQSAEFRENDPEEMVPKIDKRQKEKLSKNREELLRSTQEYRQSYENFQNNTYVGELQNLLSEEIEKVKIYDELAPELKEFRSSLLPLMNAELPEALRSDPETISVPREPQVDPNEFPMEEPEFHTETPRAKLSSKRSSQRLREEADIHTKKRIHKEIERQRSEETVEGGSSTSNRAKNLQSLFDK